jgi:hypothetical protein
MFHMLTKSDRRYIDMLLDKKLDEKLDLKIGELAIMIQNGFAECVSKNEFNELKKEFKEFKEETKENFTEIKQGVAELRYEVYNKKNDGKL